MRPPASFLRAAVLALAATAATAVAGGVVVLAPATAAVATVTISDRLEPAQLTVPPGTTVEFRNDDTARHRPRSVEGPVDFDVDLDPGERGSITLQSAGTYRYVDDRDRSDERYHGTIVVTSSSQAPPSDTTPTGAPGGQAPSGPSQPSSSPPPPSTASVSILDRSFSPSSVVVAPGGVVTWTNGSGRPHTVTSTSGAFDSGDMPSGATFRFTFPSAPAGGTFGYRCDLHPEMTGAVSVSASSATPPPPPPAAAAPPPPAGPSSNAPSAPSPPAARARAAGSAGPVTRNVRIADFAFSPASLGATVGDTIVWTNADVAPHTATSRAFDSGRLAAGGRFSTVLREPGTISYSCLLHPEMGGTIIVGAAGRPAPPPAPGAPASTSDGGLSAADANADAGADPDAPDGASSDVRAAAETAAGTRSGDGSGRRPSMAYGIVAGSSLLAATGVLLLGVKRFLAAFE